MAKSLYEIYICTSFCANSSKTFDINNFWFLVYTKNQVKIALKILAMAKIIEAKTLYI